MHRIHDHLQVDGLEAPQQCGEVELAAETFEMLAPTIKTGDLRFDRCCDDAGGQASFDCGGEVALD